MINVSDLSIRIGARTLFTGASFRVGKGARIGLVGRNGAGKTTLMRILAGVDDPRGAAEKTGNITNSGSVAYLSQDPKVTDLQCTAQQRITSVRGIDVTIEKIRQAEKLMSEPGPRGQKAMERYVRLDHEFTMQGGWAANAQAAQIAASLGVSKNQLEQPLETLSGGQRRRVELARVLFSEAEVLLLDEPTNHLDHDSIIWLRDYLRGYSGGFVIISHDVKLLDSTVNQVLYLDANRQVIDSYSLGWSAYLKQRAEDEKRSRIERANALKESERLRLQGEKMRAKSSKAVQAAQMLRRAEELRQAAGNEKAQEKVARLRFPDPAPCGKVPLRATEITKSYGSLDVLIGVDLAIDRGSKVVVLGQNGAGKTTLLRILAGVEEPDEGRIEPGHGLKLGYYAQEHETLDAHATVLENLQAVAPDYDDTATRKLLGQFLFHGDEVEKPATVLSGGEKTRLALATLVVSAANVLLLDEPTNNLDPASREEILKALASFSGAVILVTHDPGAVEALKPDRVLLLPDAEEDLWSDDYLDLITLT